MKLLLEKDDRVLFQGDSITDAGWDRNYPQNMGFGYATMAAGLFMSRYPELNVTFMNRGISGNRAVDLQARWKHDCIALRPTVISIMIGINDTWRRFDSNDPTSIDTYENAYRSVLVQAREELKARFVLIEPFVLPVPRDRLQWRVDLDPRIGVVRKLAAEFGAVLVPMDGIFAQAASLREPAYWAEDGVHPTVAGHALIARSWLNAVGA